MILILWWSLAPCGARENGGSAQVSPPAPSEIAQELLILVNQTRSERGLSPLLSSAGLVKAAEAHSRDMAGRRVLSHISTSGLHLTDRLVQAGVFFESAAENVAFSETFVAGFIHTSLMNSPEHRDNILNAEYDRVGIGVVWEEGDGYYVTQDFVQASGPEPGTVGLETHLRDMAGKTRERINALRLRRGLSPFVFQEEADALARELLERRAVGRPHPPLPPAYRMIHILYVFVTAPSLDRAEKEFSLLEHSHTHSGGMGVRFSRSEVHPGGAYDFAFLLFLDRFYMELTKTELTALVGEQITLLRAHQGMQEIRLDGELTEAARKISRSMLDGKGQEAVIPADLADFRIESYVTANPFQVPPEVVSRFTRPGIRRMGIGVIFEPDDQLPTGRFWVTLVFQ